MGSEAQSHPVLVLVNGNLHFFLEPDHGLGDISILGSKLTKTESLSHTAFVKYAFASPRI